MDETTDSKAIGDSKGRTINPIPREKKDSQMAALSIFQSSISNFQLVISVVLLAADVPQVRSPRFLAAGCVALSDESRLVG